MALRCRARTRGRALRGLLRAPGRDGPDGAARARDVPASDRYAGAAVRGLAWITGRTSARRHGGPRQRPRVLRRSAAGTRTRPLLANRRLAPGRAAHARRTARLTELNPTDRPYPSDGCSRPGAGARTVGESLSQTRRRVASADASMQREPRVRHRVAAEHPARLLQQAEEPLEAEPLPARGRAAGHAGHDVDRAADAHHERARRARGPCSPRKYSLRGELIATKRMCGAARADLRRTPRPPRRRSK